MKQTNTYLLILLSLFIFLSSNLYAKEYKWFHDYNKALTQAKIEHKDVYLFIGADICKFCKKYKETTLVNEAAMQRLTHDYVLVYLSRDRHIIPDKFEKYGVPRHYFLDSNGKVFYDTRGLLEVDGFYTMLDEAELSKNP